MKNSHERISEGLREALPGYADSQQIGVVIQLSADNHEAQAAIDGILETHGGERRSQGTVMNTLLVRTTSKGILALSEIDSVESIMPVANRLESLSPSARSGERTFP